MIALLFITALFLLAAYFVIRKAVRHGILDAERVREEWARDDRRAGLPLPDAPTS